MKNDIRRKLFQMFILGFDGENLQPSLASALKNGLGGVIFFSKNIKTVNQTKRVIRKINYNSLYTPFISIDQEGGRVERTENIFRGKKFLSALYSKQKGENFTVNQTKKISKLLKGWGFNMNFAPVLDVNTNPNNPIIGERAFSDKTDDVIKFGKIVVNEYMKNKIFPCTKHFPGHGDANTDSHLTLPVISLEYDDYISNHVRPFKEVKSPIVMVAHLHCMAFDKEKIPSSISKNVLSYFRKNISSDTLLITDDMVMGGILTQNTPAQNVSEAIRNGINLILYRDCSDSTLKIIDEVSEKALCDKVLYQKICESFNKIINFKKKYKNWF